MHMGKQKLCNILNGPLTSTFSGANISFRALLQPFALPPKSEVTFYVHTKQRQGPSLLQFTIQSLTSNTDKNAKKNISEVLC
jgi:hypothetical protein